jgi:hypothetical protein
MHSDSLLLCRQWLLLKATAQQLANREDLVIWWFLSHSNADVALLTSVFVVCCLPAAVDGQPQLCAVHDVPQGLPPQVGDACNPLPLHVHVCTQGTQCAALKNKLSHVQ